MSADKPRARAELPVDDEWRKMVKLTLAKRALDAVSLDEDPDRVVDQRTLAKAVGVQPSMISMLLKGSADWDDPSKVIWSTSYRLRIEECLGIESRLIDIPSDVPLEVVQFVKRVIADPGSIEALLDLARRTPRR